MNQMKKLIFPILAVSALLVSCNKEVDDTTDHDHDHQHTAEITISVTNPTENSAFDFGQTVTIDGTIASNMTIHGYTVTLINNSNQDSVLYLNEVHSHDSNLTVSDTWTNDLADTSNVTLRIVALGNHEGTVSETFTRSLVCNGQ